MILTFLAFAHATDVARDHVALMDALSSELARGQAGLSLPEAPPLYYARYRAMLLDQVDVHASFGGVVSAGNQPYAQLAVELRVGSAELDNSGFGGWQNGFRTAPLPSRPTPESIAAAAWRATDRAYKEAVEQYARKVAQFTPGPDHPGDFLVIPPATADGAPAPSSPPEPLVDLARAISQAMYVDAGPHALDLADVWVGHEAGVDLIVDTDGARLTLPHDETTLRAVSQVRTSNGSLLTDELLWTVRQPSDLPPRDEMIAAARAMAEALVDAADAEGLDGEYVGPVIFEGDAALDFYRYLLVPQIEGTPPEVPFDSFFGELGGQQAGSARLSRRVLPPGWSASDDPGREPRHPSSFTWDAEGAAAQAVDVVEDGIVRAVLMSRTPRTDVDATNGHARGGFGERALGRATALEIRPASHGSAKAVRKAALKLASGYGRDWVLVVRALQEPSAVAVTDYARFPSLDPASPSLPSPVVAFRRYADGREEPVQGLAFTGVSRFVLRDVVRAGAQREGSYLADSSGSVASWSPTGGLPTWISGPDVLIGEMELVPLSPDPREVPAVPPPPTPVVADAAHAAP
jgi:hypothetical protein